MTRFLTSVPGDEEIIEKLVMCEGYSPRATDEERAKIAVEILLPFDDPKWAKQYLTTLTEYGYVSDCAIFAAYYYQGKVLGLLTKNNTTPYAKQISQIFTDMIQNAQEFDAWVTDKAELQKPPECGDIIHSGEKLSTHASCVIGFDPATNIVRCVDGGQVDNTWIMLRERQWSRTSSGAMLGSKPIKGYQRIRLLRAHSANAGVSDTLPP